LDLEQHDKIDALGPTIYQPWGKVPEEVTPTFVRLAEASCTDNGRVFDLKTGAVRG